MKYIRNSLLPNQLWALIRSTLFLPFSSRSVLIMCVFCDVLVVTFLPLSLLRILHVSSSLISLASFLQYSETKEKRKISLKALL